FPSATRAITWAIGMQAAVAQRNETEPGQPIAVKVGLNAGEPLAEDGDIFGTAVQMARRICDSAGPGQILASDVVRQLAAGKGIDFRDLGKAELKGYAEAVPLYEIVASEG
ncbi:MAG TPA: adenylate/guanylate cyclase domain-containing protein, partial [Dehalococcoidia bacterium]|nr:adenylate/guanylate cyclase domain-containing protein [Dehalococcoidia bacterium]